MNAGGWIGRTDQVLHFLRTVGADRDEGGAFVLRGPDGGPSTFMGDTAPDADCVIPASVEYRAGGRWCNLAAGLLGTSYGLGVVVF